MDTRVNPDGSAWDSFAMNFQLEPWQVSDQVELGRLCEAILLHTKGEVEFIATNVPCVVHRQKVWRDIAFAPNPSGVLTVVVYYCCRLNRMSLAPSIPPLEAYIKKKLKLEG